MFSLSLSHKQLHSPGRGPAIHLPAGLLLLSLALSILSVRWVFVEFSPPHILLLSSLKLLGHAPMRHAFIQERNRTLSRGKDIERSEGANLAVAHEQPL